MATVLVRFNGGNVPIVTGDMPNDDNTPISNPTQTGFVTNKPFIVAAGPYCFGLRGLSGYAPLWQIVEAVNGQQVEIDFRHNLP
jgi:hypothetical protein